MMRAIFVQQDIDRENSRVRNIMKRVMRCHDFGSGLEVRGSPYVDRGKENDDTMGQNSCQPEGLRPESALVLSANGGNIDILPPSSS